MSARGLAFKLAALALAHTGIAGAQVHKSLRIDSVPPGARVYLSVAGERKPLGTTPFDYEAEFHSPISVLKLHFERAGHTAVEQEITPARDRFVATLPAARVVAAPASAGDPGLRALLERITPAADGAVRASLAAPPAEGVQLDGTVGLRRAEGTTYLVVPLVLPYTLQPSSSAGESARRMWRELASDLAARVRKVVPPASGLGGIVIQGRLNVGGSSFAVNSSAESKTEIACLPGTRMTFDGCATRQPTYETYCNTSAQCFQRTTGSRCVSGMKPVYDPCATKGPVTKYVVTVDPRATVHATHARAIVALDFAAGGTQVRLAEFDDQGREVFREGGLPREFDEPASATAR